MSHTPAGPVRHSVPMGPPGDDLNLATITTVRSPVQPNVLWVIVEDQDGHQGLGETFYGSAVVEEYVHREAAGMLSAGAHRSRAGVSQSLDGYVGYSGSGAEVRGNAAIDIALWDLAARRAGMPLRNILGGSGAGGIGVYNTCAGNQYVSHSSQQSSRNWGIDDTPDGRYEDLHAFLTRPAALARDLLAEGYTGMKVWPFDIAAEEARGGVDADLSFGLWVLDEIRESVGSAMDLYIELHSLWTPAGASRLLRALEAYDLAWVEDPVRADHWQDLRDLTQSTPLTIAAGENVGAGANGYPLLIDSSAVDVVIVDMGWSGGVTQALDTAERAQRRGLTIAPHDCTGPVALAVAGHLVTAVPNGHVQELSRAFYHGWYQTVATGLPAVASGELRMHDTPGHGVALREDFLGDPSTVERVTRISAKSS